MCKSNLKLLKRFPILSQKHTLNFARKPPKKTSSKRLMMVLKKHLNATFKLLTGDDVDGSILLGDVSTASPLTDNKNFKKEQ